jgi:hypothetical protein
MKNFFQVGHYTIMTMIPLLMHLFSHAQKPVKIDKETFKTVIKDDKLLLLSGEDQVVLASGADWHFSELYFGEETNIVDSLRGPRVVDLPDPNGVKAIKLSKNRYLLLLSFYTARSDARVASGMDIFIVYQSDIKQFWSVSWDLMPRIGRGAGPCRNADMTFYLLQDINEDGLIDIGVLREMITCDFENDAPSKPYYAQQPIKWYVNISDNYAGETDYWLPNRLYEAGLHNDYAEIFSVSSSPVEVVGSGLWNTTDRLKWPTKLDKEAIVITKDQKYRIVKEAKKLKDRNTLERYSAYQYLERTTQVRHYDQAAIMHKADSIVDAELGVYSAYFSLSDWYEEIVLYTTGNSRVTKQLPVTRYQYIDDHYLLSDGYFGDAEATIGDFENATLTYHLQHDAYDWMQGKARIHFDKALRLQRPMDFEGIPEFILNGGPPNYLTKEQALEASVKHSMVADQPFLKLAEIEFSQEQEVNYHWKIQNYHQYPRDSTHVCFVQEIIILEPTTGGLIRKFEPSQAESFIDCPTDQ